MASIFRRGLRALGRANPVFAPYSLATRSDKPRSLGRSLAGSAAAGASAIPGGGGFGAKALKYGPTLASAALGFGNGGDKPLDWASLEGGPNPQGFNTPEDMAAAEAVRGRLRRDNASTAAQRRQLVLRRAAQRGTLGSTATDTTLSRVGQDEALGNEHAGGTAEDLLYNARLGRERFGQTRALTIMGGRIQDASSRRYANTIRHTAFLNSLLDMSKSSLDALGNAGMDSGQTYTDQGVYDDSAGA